ncbi:MAG: hypothetical protein C5B55_01100 [Blastocatellia bacterium]|nr:MAG: hypothetical protein C5B55_01100 [Blastocatellia bacterium]
MQQQRLDRGKQLQPLQPLIRLGAIYFLFVISIHAQNPTTTFGGPGGDPYSVNCGNDKIMVGLQIKTGSHFAVGYQINMARPICVSVDAGGDWVGTPAATSSYAGTDSGTLSSVTCPTNQAVTGFGGYAGLYVDGISLACSSMRELGTVANDQAYFGNLLGFHDFEGMKGIFSCVPGMPANGISGHAHDWLDKFGLTCHTPTTPSPTVDSITTTTNTLVGGNPVQGTVFLNAPAPSGGLRVGISNQVDVADAAFIPSNPTTPDPLNVPATTKTVSFGFNTLPVPHVVTVKLNPGPGSASHFVSKTITILPPSLTSVSLSPSVTSPGGSETGTITLNGNAPVGGVAANLTSSFSSVATVPPSVSVSPGTNSATFPITVASTNESGCSVISASGLFTPQGGTSIRQSLLTVKGPLNSAFKLGANNISASGATGTIFLEQANREPGTITLVSSNPSLLGVPSTIPVPASTQSLNFAITVQSRPPSGISCAAITVTDPHGNKNSMVFLIDTSLRRVE